MVVFSAGGVSFLIRDNHDVPVGVFSFTLRINILVILKDRVNGAPLIGVHRLKRYCFSCSLDLSCHALCQSLKIFLASFPVVFRIQLNAQVILALFIDNQAGKLLKGVQKVVRS